MLLLFFRLMAIDMTLFQFIDWFLEQFEEEEEAEQIEEEIRALKELEDEILTAKPERKLEIQKKIVELTAHKMPLADRKKSIEKQIMDAAQKQSEKTKTKSVFDAPEETSAKPALQLPMRTSTTD